MHATWTPNIIDTMYMQTIVICYKYSHVEQDIIWMIAELKSRA